MSSESKCPAVPGRRPQFGNRFLKKKENVFEHNAWDNVVWDENQEAAAKEKVLENSEVTLSTEEIQKLEEEAADQWDSFYSIHQNRFFKDRNWLFTEFPELAPHLAHTFPVKHNAVEAPNSLESTIQDEDHTACSEQENESVNSPADTVKRRNEEKFNVMGNDVVEREYPHVTATNNLCSDLEGEIELQGTKVVKPSLNEIDLKECQTSSSSTDTSEEAYPGERAKFRILEVGCGVGNTVFPILKVNNDDGLFVYCCDFSSTAVDIVRGSPEYEEKRCHAFVCDVTSDDWGAPFPKASLDVIVCIFVLSAIHPDRLLQVVRNMAAYLRPGGVLLFRDYGRFDMAQLRFKKGRCLADNFYVRGDGTRCYFFTQGEVKDLMMQAGLEEIQNLVDRRLQVNRGKQLTMYRVWVQAKYRKPDRDSHPSL